MAAAIAMALVVSPPRPAGADSVTPPPVPIDIQVPAGNRPSLKDHAVGTQDSICLPAGWKLFGPQATLFDDLDRQIITAFVAPGAIPWFLPQVIGSEEGPTGGDKLAPITFIQRLNTSGGRPPAADCTEIGRTERIPCTADYYFYRATRHR
jgi:hypothetical protein